MKKEFTLTVFGARGSVPSSRAENIVYGGDTSCYMVRAGKDTIFLDGGSGLAAAPTIYPKPPVILLSHLHLDHVMGLGMFTGFFVPGQKARVYVPFCEDAEAAEARMAQIYMPPFWPMRLSQLEGKPEILPMPDHFSVGEVQVETMEGNHPNRSMILKLSFGKKSLVYATDYEHKEPSFSRLIQFAKNADLLMYDAQFTEAQYPSRRGFGHSTAKKGMELMRRSKAKRLLLIHHAPGNTDALLSRREKKIQNENISYAREGQVILI